MYECFHCGKKAVIWDCDFDFSDFGYDGEGIVHCCHCTECGAEIECDSEAYPISLVFLCMILLRS